MIGNDIVDLGDPRTFRLHPRFDSRVFTGCERERVEDHTDRWLLWACKEAAFKALNGIDPSVRFVPSEFEVQGGSVRWFQISLPVRVELGEGYVHAIAGCGKAQVARREGDRHEAVRALASRLMPDEDFSGKRPEGVSFSHHGRWVAVAFTEFRL